MAAKSATSDPQQGKKSSESFFTAENEFSDVVFVVEGNRLYTNKYVLSCLSPVFHAMFTGNYIERYSKTVELKEKKYQDVLDFLVYTKPSSGRNMTVEQAVRLYPLFNEYQMDKEKKRSMTVIRRSLRKFSTPQEVFYACVQLACIFDLPKLYKLCVTEALVKPDTHFDALVNMQYTPIPFQEVFFKRLKRTASEHIKCIRHAERER